MADQISAWCTGSPRHLYCGAERSDCPFCSFPLEQFDMRGILEERWQSQNQVKHFYGDICFLLLRVEESMAWMLLDMRQRFLAESGLPDDEDSYDALSPQLKAAFATFQLTSAMKQHLFAIYQETPGV